MEINVSAPIVPFLETIVTPPKLDMVNEAISSGSNASMRKSIEILTANKFSLFRLRAAPIPSEILQFLQENENLLKLTDDRHQIPSEMQKAFCEFRDRLREKFAESNSSDFPPSVVDRIWAFGPRKARLNLLINAIDSYKRPSLFGLHGAGFGSQTTGSEPQAAEPQVAGSEPQVAESQAAEPQAAEPQVTGLGTQAAESEPQATGSSDEIRNYDQSVVHGFHLRCQAGPLCEEPLRGVAFFVEAWEFGADSEDTTATDAYGPISGQIIATIKEGCKQAFQAQPQRLMIAMYSCQIQATADVLGKVYSVLNKRGGRVSDFMLVFFAYARKKKFVLNFNSIAITEIHQKKSKLFRIFLIKMFKRD